MLRGREVTALKIALCCEAREEAKSVEQSARPGRISFFGSSRLGNGADLLHQAKLVLGKLLGSGPPPYGFRWVRAKQGKRVGLEVDPETMPVVHPLFEMVGAYGLPMYSAGKELERQGFYAPKGGMWRVGVIRNILLNDVYKPHTIEELRALGIAEEVVATLDAAEEYGVSWFG